MIHDDNVPARTHKWRVLIVGAGNIAGGLDRDRRGHPDPFTHAGAYLGDGRFEIIGCVEPDAAAREAFAEAWSVPHCFEDLAAIPVDLGFDIVSICSPTACHAADVGSALRLSPKLIFCEKPLTERIGESEDLVARCAAAGVRLCVNHNRRWAPDIVALRRELQTGRWGALRAVHGTYTKGVLNNGAHLIDLIHYLLGATLDVAWAGPPRHDFWPDDPTIPAALRTPDGLVVQLSAGDAGDYARFELELLTSKAAITMEEGGLRWRTREAVDSADFPNYRMLDSGRFTDGRYAAAMRHAVANIHDALADGTELASTGESALAAQRVCEKIRAASRRGGQASTMTQISNQPLALLGGQPVITQPFAPFRTVGEEEATAAAEVVRSGVLSAYVGARSPAFMGGEHVRAFEAKAAALFEVKHAIAVNSWTSGLIAAVGAIGVEPGDEIITTPWTMAATATAILMWNAIPVFADIDPQSFNIDPASVERLIGPRTRAIMAVDIFGQSAEMRALREIADRHGLKLLTDTAQAPGARYFDKPTGTLADIGGFSLNYHKHIHSGEGGIIVTNDDRLADRLRLIRNHGEAVIDSEEPAELANILGYNFRLGEIEAAIASVQLDKLPERIDSRQHAAAQLDAGLQGLEGLATPVVSEGCTHVYYIYGLTLDVDLLGISRERLLEALRAEGVPGLAAGYQNLHLLPMFRNRIAYGTKGFPWTSPYVDRDVTYGPGLCPVAEDLHARRLIAVNLCLHEFTPEEIDLVILAFHKVWSNLDRLREG